MQGPLIDLVLMVLLILFFGMQQRGRPQRYYRYWLVAWLFVLTSFALFELPDALIERIGHWSDPARHAIEMATLMLGGLAFVISFMGPDPPLARLVKRVPWWLLGTCAGVWAAVLCVPMLMPTPLWVAVVLVVLGEGKAALILWRIVPGHWKRLRWVVPGLCVPGLMLGLVALWTSSMQGKVELGPDAVGFGAPVYGFMGLDTVVELQIFVAAALLFGNASRARRLVKWLGVAGFVMWAAWYVVGDLLHVVYTPALPLFYQIWQLPKYCVGLAMILEIFDATESEVRRLADDYRLLYEDFRVLYENHPYPMWIREPASDRCLSVNGAALEHYGYSEAEFLPLRQDQIEMRPAENAEPMEGILQEPVTGRRAQHISKHGKVFWMNVWESEILFQGQDALLVMARDISAQLKITQELARRANFDALTGLPNRTLLSDRADVCLARCRREDNRGVVFAIDVDHFKHVNDTYGHATGDECLQAVAARLQSRVRQVDTLARPGGEEFTAVIGGLLVAEDAQKIGQSLVKVMQEPIQLPGLAHPLWVTVSIGGAVFPDDGPDFATLSRRADEALYEAKRSGRNCVRMYGSSGTRQPLERGQTTETRG